MSTSTARAASADTAGRSGWLFGPAPDLLLGCGGAYAALTLILFLVRPDMGRISPWLPLLILVTGIPHYGATLLRIAATPEDRRRYAMPALLLSVAVLALFLAGLVSPRLGSWQITAYLSLSPWHYAAQNYGLTMLFLRRRGVQLDRRAARWLRLSFVVSYLLVLLSYHQRNAAGGADPLYFASSGYRFVPVGISESVTQVAAPLLLLIYALTLTVAIRRMLRSARPQRLLPAGALLLSQLIWFSLPALGLLLARGRYPTHHVALAFIWIAVGHCVQYLWISLYYQRRAQPGAEASAASPALYLARATLVGAALWFVPAMLFAPGALGLVTFDAGLGLLVAAAVNLHHFGLDGMIWKLRDPRLSSMLIAGEKAAVRTPRAAREGSSLLATSALITVGGLSVFAWVAIAWEKEVGHHRAFAAGDLDRLEQASLRLAALGRDGAQIHIALGTLHARQGRAAAAAIEFERSLRLHPTAAAWVALGRLHRGRGDLQAAAAAYQEALRLEPNHAVARQLLEQLGQSSSQLSSAELLGKAAQR